MRFRRSAARFALALIAAASAACGLDFVGVSTPDDNNNNNNTNNNSNGEVNVGADAASADAITQDGASSGSSGGDGGGGDGQAAVSCVLSDGGAGISCDGKCIDPSTDRKNCGGCGTVCKSWAACEGKCVDVAASLVAFRHEIACTNELTPCAIVASSPPDKQATLTGTPQKTYSIAIRVRGVVEQKTYNNAQAGPAVGTNASYFVSGGSGNGGDNWNLYELSISAPGWTWQLNSGASGHTYSDPIDYTATIKASTGATLKLHADSYDKAQAKNRTAGDAPIYVPNVPPSPDYFHGQFVQIDVVSVTPSP